jgi:DNA-directed RNA polymerase specialized sigma subunit
MEESRSVSELLIAWGRGEPAALEQLTPRVYHELHKLARAYLRRGRPTQSLQPTALINEVLDRLAAVDERKAKVIEMRYFGGMDREEVAFALGLTVAIVKQDLRLGEAWLRRFLAGQTP